MDNKNDIKRLYKGIITDVSEIDQPKGSYRYALNTVRETEDGDENLLTDEHGNEQVLQLTDTINNKLVNFIIIGNIDIENNQHILFLLSDDLSNSRIILYDGKQSTTIINDIGNTALNFDINHRCSGEYRVRNGKDKTIYWVDDYNPTRTLIINNTSYLYDTNNVLQANRLNLIKSYNKMPSIDSVEIIGGGQVLSGSYNIAIQLIDKNNNTTEWITTTNPVAIFSDISSGNYKSIHGSSNIPAINTSTDHVLFGSISTTKAIKWTISNLDTDYEHYKIAVLCATKGFGKVNQVLVSQSIPLSVTEFIFDNDIQNYTEIPVENILVNHIDIDTVKVIRQVENKLLFVGIKGKDRNLCSLQTFASKIKTEYILDLVDEEDYNQPGNPKDPTTMWDKMSMMGGEVYARGIVYIFDDLTESPVYHIPGRPIDNTVDTFQWMIYNEDLAPFLKYSDYILNEDITPATGKHPDENKVYTWQIDDTAETADMANPTTPKRMAYHQNKIGVYENPSSFVGDYWGKDWAGNILTGQQIRHHKYPSRNRVPLINEGTTIAKNTVTISVGNNTTTVYGTVTYTINYTDTNSQPASISGTITLPVGREIFFPSGGSQVFPKSETYNLGVIEGTNPVLDSTCQLATTVANSGGNLLLSNPVIEVVYEVINNKKIVLIGTQFSNIQLPPNVIGYYLVRGDRDEFNRTIVSKGYSGSIRKNNEYLAFSGITENYTGALPTLPYEFSKLNKFILTPENLFENKISIGNLINIEGEFRKVQDQTLIQHTDIVQGVDDVKGGWFDNDGFDWVGGNTIAYFKFSNKSSAGASTDLPRVTRKIIDNNFLSPLSKKEYYLDTDTSTQLTKSLYNATVDNKVQIVKLSDNYDTTEDLTQSSNINLSPYTKIYYVSQVILKDIHPVLDNIKYYKTHNNMFSDTSPKNIFDGDTYISPFNITTSTSQGYKTKKRILDFVVKILIAVAGVIVTIATLGTSSAITVPLIVATVASALAGISIEAYKTFANDAYNTSLLDVIKSITKDTLLAVGSKDDTYFSAMDVATGLYVESDINVALREEANYGPVSFLDNFSARALNSYEKKKFIYFDEKTGKDRLLPIPTIELYKYNRDFSRINKERVFFALSSLYNCNSKYDSEFPNRIYYSQPSYDEDKFDNYAVILPLNYIDIPSDEGEITNLYVLNGALFIHTANNMWFLPANVQEKVIGDIITLVGTGGFFPMPPIKMFDSIVNSRGSVLQSSTLSLDNEVLFISEKDKKIYILSPNKSAVPITDAGNAKWFNNNMDFVLSDDIYNLLNYQIKNIDNAHSPFGIGYTLGYDNKLNRIIVTKRDYHIINTQNIRLVNESNPQNISILNTLIAFNSYDEIFYEFNTTTTLWERIKLDDTQIVESRKWTVSFSIRDKALISYHAYTPQFYVSDNSNFYSSLTTSNSYIYKHDAKNYCNFYGVQYPFIIDYIISNQLNTEILEYLMLQTKASKANVEEKNVTFDKLMIYDTRQCTGDLTLKVPDVNKTMMLDTIKNELGVITIKRHNENWFVNMLRDYVVSPLVNIFGLNRFTNYYVDKVLNTNNIDYSKDWSQLEPMKDKWFGIRLTYLAVDNLIKLTVNYLVDFKTNIKD